MAKWDSFACSLLSLIFGGLVLFFNSNNGLSILPFGGNLLFVKSLFELDISQKVFPWDVLLYFVISNLLYGMIFFFISLKVKEKQKESF